MTAQRMSLAVEGATKAPVEAANDRARKAACVLAILPPDLAASILGASSPEQRRLFALALQEIDGAAPELVESASLDFIAEVERINEEALGGIAALREKFRADPPAGSGAVELAPPLPDVFGARKVEDIASYLAEQRSVVAAALIQTLDPEMASDILSRLPSHVANRIVAELARAPAAEPRRKAALFDAIVSDLAMHVAGPKELGEGFASVEALMPLVDAARRDDMLMHLTMMNPLAGEKLRQSLILFEDISRRLPEGAAARIVGDIEKATLLAVLARAEAVAPATAAYLLGAMSKRMREQIAEEQQTAPPVSAADQTAGERRLMAVIRRMIGDGQITPLPPSEAPGPA